jgi:hypothetical protein
VLVVVVVTELNRSFLGMVLVVVLVGVEQEATLVQTVHQILVVAVVRLTQQVEMVEVV